MKSLSLPLAICCFTGLIVFLGGCVILIRRAEVTEIQKTDAPVDVTSPVKAHLWDGSVVVFANGVQIGADSLIGTGTRYSLTLRNPVLTDRVALDSVAAMETFRAPIDENASAGISLLATLVGVPATIALFKAVFGSCPTIYSEGADGPVLEAESFSNSIAPLFEMRDVARLHVRADDAGVVVLEVRNEALETHYINHVELLEVQHKPDELAVPGERGSALLLRDLVIPTSMVDRAGNDVKPLLETSDDHFYSTDERTLRRAHRDDLTDHIDLLLPAPLSDSAAVVLRLRNSLLNTVHFYEFMLAAQGADALNWIGRDLETIRSAVALGDFFARRMGLRVQIWDGDEFREVGKIREVGPIAWKDLAVPFSVPSGDSLRIRLSFVAESWRLDRVAVAVEVRTESPRPIAPQQVLDANGRSAPSVLDDLASSDEAYVITGPGDRFRVRFAAGPEPHALTRTFFLAAQGYYIEWIRTDWIRERGPRRPYVASDETLFAALRRWLAVRETFEQRFEETRIPVR